MHAGQPSPAGRFFQALYTTRPTMQIIKNELSIAAQAGALDASLQFSVTYEQHRDLISQTAASGLRGLQDILSETGIYGAAMRSLQEATSLNEAANAAAHRDPFFSDGSGRSTTAVNNGRHIQSNALNPTISNAQATASNAVNGTATGTAERNAGNAVLNAANGVASANAAFYNGDPSQVQTAYNNAYNARNEASNAFGAATTLLNNTPLTPPGPRAAAQARYDSALAVLNAAGTVLNAAQRLVDLRATPIGQLAGVSPSSNSDLGNGYTLSTWGSTGLVTITDSSGQGIVISPNGSVDPLDGAGNGWKFNSTSTFILPGETKVTFNVGPPANILASRGIHAFTVGNLQVGSSASLPVYNQLNGRTADRSSNDGYIINLNGDAAHWTLGGSVLGDAGSREVVATSHLNNELKLDPTDVAISTDLRDFINALGITNQDYDGDGKLNNEELVVVSNEITNYIRMLQEQYEQALAKLAKANEALSELNTLLELIRKQSDKTNENRSSDNAAAKAELQSVERKLLAALEALNGSSGSTGTGGINIEAGAGQILQQLTDVTQGGLQTPPPTITSNTTPTNTQPLPPSNNVETLGQPLNNQGSDPLGDSLRRASKLLSGLLGGGNLNILELPPGNQPVEGTGETPSDLSVLTSALPALEDLGASLATLVTDLNTQIGTLPASNITGPNLGAGLEGLLTALANAGLIDGSLIGETASGEDLLQFLAEQLSMNLSDLTQEGVGVGNGPPSAASLLSFLGILAQFGSALKAVAPQVAQTTPGQQERASTASLTPLSATAQQVAEILAGMAELGSAGAQQSSGSGTAADGSLTKLSRVAEQLQLVLQGLAELGSAGASQSSKNEGADAPTSAELRLGLQSFLMALVAFGVFSVNQSQDEGSSTSSTGQEPITFGTENRTAIATISGNFTTDPELLKIIEANLNKALQIQNQQLKRATTLFTQSQEIVQKFVDIIKQDDLVHDVVKSDELSDDQQALFDDRMQDLRKDWGIDWGGPEDNKTPAGQTNLTTKVVQSGLMV